MPPGTLVTRQDFAPHVSIRDESVRAAAVSALQGSGYSSLSALTCRVEEGEIWLSGSVPSFYLKQFAQESLRRLQHVRGIRNEVEVG